MRQYLERSCTYIFKWSNCWTDEINTLVDTLSWDVTNASPVCQMSVFHISWRREPLPSLHIAITAHRNTALVDLISARSRQYVSAPNVFLGIITAKMRKFIVHLEQSFPIVIFARANLLLWHTRHILHVMRL